MREETKEKCAKWAALTVLMAVFAIGTVTIYPKFRRTQALQAKSVLLQAKIDQKKREIAVLREYQSRFKGDADFVETIARQNRRVFPGELVFVFEDD